MFEEIIVAVIVAVAGVFVWRSLRRSATRPGRCAGCVAPRGGNAPKLVKIERPDRTRPSVIAPRRPNGAE